MTAKGIEYGTIIANPDGTVDTSQVVGVDPDFWKLDINIETYGRRHRFRFPHTDNWSSISNFQEHKKS